MATPKKEIPRVGVFVCHCGINIGGVVKVSEVVEFAKTIPDVAYAEANLYTCSSEGISKIKEAIKKYNLNRVVVASCTPRTHEPLFRNACEEAGLNKYLFEMANIRDQCSWAHMHEPEKATTKAKDLVKMAVAKARLLEPQDEPEIDVTPSALVIGGGISGMTAALSMANQGFNVNIVEREPELGGMLAKLHMLCPNFEDASKALSSIVDAVKSNQKINVLTSSEVEDVKGFIGNFDVTVKKDDKPLKLNQGTIVVATGAENFEPINMYGYKSNENVLTQMQLEKLLKTGDLRKPDKVVMIQCVGAREEKGRQYCSRICCGVAIKNALIIKDLYPETELFIIFRDLQTYGQEYEACYTEAREKGVHFIKYTSSNPPEVSSNSEGKLTIKTYDAFLKEMVELESDLVVLSTPLIPQKDAEKLSKILKVPLGSDGFFFEAHVKLRPIDFATDGIFVCGSAHSPKDISESISQALGVASRAAIPMANKHVRADAITSIINEDLCSGCGTCVRICPYGAIQKNEIGIAQVTSVVCKGCGTCAASCPEKAITMRHFTDDQITAQALAALEG
ncbi:MAG: heterodisulfide reductase subunit [Thermoproteota archaeon]|nr:heterodisulfide reductase subunit [Thermoproteota archaeon]